MKTDKLRDRFLDFFKNKKHKLYPSDSLVPLDPTVLFTSAGMNQFKPYFLGEKKDISRAASCQKCLRTGDLESVGATPFHHTFFEMLGNFSFGDYFKKEAIEYAWEFSLKELNLKADDLWISVYQDDEEAFTIWRAAGIPEHKIVRLGADSNFWPANAPLKGPNGPCGPCSEIFFDKGKAVGCKKESCGPACDCGRFVEVWNLVFTQFNRVGENKLKRLSQKNIDTGMGIERMASVLQDKDSNFGIDILFPVVNYVREYLRKPSPDQRTRRFIHAIVDHARAASFAIGDGVFPSNEERGYVIRRLIRKAAYHGYMLGRKKPFLYKLVPLYAELMRSPYPELWDKKEDTSAVIRAEEEKFLTALDAGKVQLRSMLDKAKNDKRAVLSGQEVFKLYDTYGFPLETIKDLAREDKFTIDEGQFSVLLEKQKELSRKQSMFEEAIFSREEFSFTERTEFVGYERLDCEANIIKIIKDKKEARLLEKGNEGILILDKTPFYPESGGQAEDKGTIKTPQGTFAVEHVKKVNETIIHAGRLVEGKIEPAVAQATVDYLRRKGLTRAHTATHLLQAALRTALGTHVTQQGSFVDADRLRFDFAHFQSLTKRQLCRVEELINNFILQGDAVEKRVVSYDEAKKEKALAFFEEKYSEYVRMVVISDYSKELCGGTHVDNTIEIGSFCILWEYSVSSGIRRIEAVVGEKAYEKFSYYKDLTLESSELLKAKEDMVIERIKSLQKEVKEDKDKIDSLEKQILASGIERIIRDNIHTFKKAHIVLCEFTRKKFAHLLYLSDEIRKEISSGIVFFVSKNEDSTIFVLGTTNDMEEREFSCKKFIDAYKEKLKLSGGGRPSLCQGVVSAAGDFASYKESVLESIKEYMAKSIE